MVLNMKTIFCMKKGFLWGSVAFVFSWKKIKKLSKKVFFCTYCILGEAVISARWTSKTKLLFVIFFECSEPLCLFRRYNSSEYENNSEYGKESWGFFSCPGPLYSLNVHNGSEHEKRFPLRGSLRLVFSWRWYTTEALKMNEISFFLSETVLVYWDRRSRETIEKNLRMKKQIWEWMYFFSEYDGKLIFFVSSWMTRTRTCWRSASNARPSPNQSQPPCRPRWPPPPPLPRRNLPPTKTNRRLENWNGLRCLGKSEAFEHFEGNLPLRSTLKWLIGWKMYTLV